MPSISADQETRAPSPSPSAHDHDHDDDHEHHHNLSDASNTRSSIIFAQRHQDQAPSEIIAELRQRHHTGSAASSAHGTPPRVQPANPDIKADLYDRPHSHNMDVAEESCGKPPSEIIAEVRARYARRAEDGGRA